MSAFKAWGNVILFGGLGALVLAGYKLPTDPTCQIRCYINSMAHLQAEIGDEPLAMILFFCGAFGYVWYTIRM